MSSAFVVTHHINLYCFVYNFQSLCLVNKIWWWWWWLRWWCIHGKIRAYKCPNLGGNWGWKNLCCLLFSPLNFLGQEVHICYAPRRAVCVFGISTQTPGKCPIYYAIYTVFQWRIRDVQKLKNGVVNTPSQLFYLCIQLYMYNFNDLFLTLVIALQHVLRLHHASISSRYIFLRCFLSGIMA